MQIEQEKNNELTSFYKDNVHNFYNIDMIEHKYKQYPRYKTIPEISKYIKNQILESKNNNNIEDFTTRNIVKKSIYKLFGKTVIKKEITLDQITQIIELIKNNRKPKSIFKYAKNKSESILKSMKRKTPAST